MIFTKSEMWQVAVEQMGTEFVQFPIQAICLFTPEDVEELYKALQEAHWKAVELNEKGVV